MDWSYEDQKFTTYISPVFPEALVGHIIQESFVIQSEIMELQLDYR